MGPATDPASAAFHRSAGTLIAALRANEQHAVTQTVLSLRRELHTLAARNPKAQDRLAQLSQGLRQIDHAARAGDFLEARRTLALWTQML